VRFADDCNISVRSQRACERVMAGIEQFLAKRLELKVNKTTTAVAPPRGKFLGFSFTMGSEIKRRLAPQTVVRFKPRVREATRGTSGKSLAQIVEELARYLTGWRADFGLLTSSTSGTLPMTDSRGNRNLRILPRRSLCSRGHRHRSLYSRRLHLRSLRLQLDSRRRRRRLWPQAVCRTRALQYFPYRKHRTSPS
jgi:hypothetical protein